MALRFVPSATLIWIIALTIIIAGSLIAQSSAEFLIYGLVWRKGEVPDDVINPKDVDMKKWQSVIFAIAVVAVLVVFILLYFFWHVMSELTPCQHTQTHTHTHTHTHTRTHTHTHTHTHRHTHAHTHRHTCTHTHRHTCKHTYRLANMLLWPV